MVVDDYLPRAIEMYKLRFPDVMTVESDIKQLVLPEIERFLNFFGALSTEELQRKSPIVQYDAYHLGILVSKTYTQEEIEAKKSEYLAMLPLPESGQTVKRWQYEVERQVGRSDFLYYPDKIFLMLDTFRKIGTVS